jgi:putative hydrolase of the HAD superfamily
MTIEAVIWDFGGVFTTSPFEAFNRFEAARGLPKDLIRTLNATNPHANAWALFERAEIDAAGFDEIFAAEAKALGHDVRGADVLPLLSGEVRPRVVAALRACKQRFGKVGCITNNMASAGHGAGMASSTSKAAQIAEIMGLFDAVIESSKVGVRKPDPKIYLMMCDLLSVKPDACIYLDDLGINCKPAAALGMAAIKVTTEDQAMMELAKLTGLEL